MKKCIALFAALALLLPAAAASGTTVILLSDAGARITGSGAAWEDGSVIVTAGGEYEISGAGDARIVVDAKGGDVTLTLRGAEIRCPDSAAIFVRRAEQVTIVVPEGEEATLSDGSEYRFDDEWSSAKKTVPDGCVYADCDLILTGGGALTVRGNDSAGISGKDDVEIRGLSLAVEAVSNGIRGKDSLTIADSAVTVRAGGADEDAGKGLLSSGAVRIESGDISVESGDDAVHGESVAIAGGDIALSTLDDAIHADGTLSISGGSVRVLSSIEGIEAATILISGGAIRIRSLDDGINAAGDDDAGSAGFLRISGGDIRVYADGDGVDVNGNMAMTGGTLLVSGSSDPRNGALDFDGAFSFSGGMLFAAGHSAMALSPTTASFPVLTYTFPSILPAGSMISIVGQGAKYAICLEKDADNIVFSAPDLAPGEYEIRLGGTFPGEEGELVTPGCAEGGESVAFIRITLD